MGNNERKYLNNTKIAVLCGGLSSEREVSLRSGKNVFNATLPHIKIIFGFRIFFTKFA